MKRSNTTRRDFLKTGGATLAAGIAIPYFLSGASVRAGESKADKLIVASIGVGGRGTDIGLQAADLGNLVACADVHLGHANTFAAKVEKKGGKCQVYQDYRKVLDRKDVQAVTIGTPDHWHVKVAIDAMNAGKDVYCEKPLTLTIDESRIICEAVKKSGRVFQVGTQQRSEFGDAFLEAVAIVRSGRLGKKLAAKAIIGKAQSGGPFPTAEPPKEMDWDFWLGQAPTVAFCPNRGSFDFRWWLDYSGGQITDWGAHHTDISLWALGGDKTGPSEIEGQGEFPLGRELTRDYMLGRKSLADLPNSYNVARSFDCKMKLPNGNTLELTSSGNEDIKFVGEKGQLAVNRGGIRGKFVKAIKDSPTDKKWLQEEVAKLYRGMSIHGHMANFFDCVKSRALPISDVYTHCVAVNTCHAANIAMLL
ncbi:MAG: Gfo/Idh/MocA family oxidoreductase, partial [Thermoguttaceae bacterium]